MNATVYDVVYAAGMAEDRGSNTSASYAEGAAKDVPPEHTSTFVTAFKCEMHKGWGMISGINAGRNAVREAKIVADAARTAEAPAAPRAPPPVVLSTTPMTNDDIRKLLKR